MGGTPTGTAPACAEWTRTAGPDESVLLTGSRLSNYTGQGQGKDTRFVLSDGSATTKEVSLQRLDDNKAVLTMPQSVAQWGMYLVWPGNADGYGAPMALNRTEAWWVGPEKATRGATVSVFGRNLAHHNDTLAAYVLIKPSGGAGQWATVRRVNPYKVDFVLPANLADGDYEVWAHNGHGQQYGWSGPLKLTVTSGPQWTSQLINVKTYGATGNGVSDDTPAITKALAAAKQAPGSTVYFPAGTYAVSNTLWPSANTRWKGDGKSTSIIKCASNFSSSAEALVQGSVENLEMRDMAFLGNKNYKGTQPEPIFLRGSKEVRLTNVLFSFQGYNVLQLDNAYGVYITGCEMIGKTSFLGHCSQLFINGCKFKLTNDAEMALDSWGGSCISVTNSTCQDYDNSNPADGAGWGKGRFYAGRGNFGSSRCTYIGSNRTIDLAVRPVGADQNSGEQLMWEGYTTDWASPVTAATATTATLGGWSSKFDNVHYALITKGTGLGQARRITAYNGATITLDEPWTLAPDNTSVISLANSNDRAVVYDNYLDGKQYAVTSLLHNASSGIEPYGATSNFIAAGNTVAQARVGIANWATQNQVELDANYFGLFANNKLVDCRWGILNSVYMPHPKDLALFGTTYRGNQVVNALQSAVVNTLPEAGGKVVLSYFLYEHNSLQSALNGYSTGGDLGLPGGYPATGQGIDNQFFYKNAFATATAAGTYGLRTTLGSVARENTFHSYAQLYAGTPNPGRLEAPYHVVELAGTTRPATVAGRLTLWNAGGQSLDWSASSDAAWLTLPVAKGALPNENSSTTLVLNAATAGLGAGRHTATITVVAGGRTTQYTVVLTIAATPPPTVGITTPGAGSRFTGVASLDIVAEASVLNDVISKVEFFVDAVKIGEASAAPYRVAWKQPAVGAHKLTAKATSSSGFSALSSEVDVLINRLLVTTVSQQTNLEEVFPNPMHQLLTVSMPSSDPVTYRLLSPTAAMVRTGQFVRNTVLDVRDLAAGFYMLELMRAGQRTLYKLTKTE